MVKQDTRATTDHEEIRKWAEERDGRPATVEGTGDGHAGVLRFQFREGRENLKEISWEEFFEKFEEEGLALLYQEETARGGESRFFKIVTRDTAREAVGR